MKTTSIIRSLALSALATGALVVPAQPALAERSFEEIPTGTFAVPCPDSELTVAAAGKYAVIELPGGRTKTIWPGVSITVTGESGESVTFEGTAGLTHTTPLSNGNQLFTATGRNFITVPDANDHPVGVFLTIGTVSWILDENEDEVGGMFTGTGRVTDLCALLG